MMGLMGGAGRAGLTGGTGSAEATGGAGSADATGVAAVAHAKAECVHYGRGHGGAAPGAVYDKERNGWFVLCKRRLALGGTDKADRAADDCRRLRAVGQR